MASKQCAICNEKSGMYPLCKKHLAMIKTNEVIKQDGKWVLNNKDKEETLIDVLGFSYVETPLGVEYENDTHKCYVCGADSYSGKQCKSCYYETVDFKTNIDKNRKAHEFREWYYNLKNSIYKIKNKDNVESNCNKLIALAILCRDLHDDDSLLSRVYTDIQEINKKFNTKENIKTAEFANYDENKNETSGQVKCQDGHWVENDLEREIDDILYSLRRVHVYAKKVNEITERTVKSDWFIPILSDTKGIYIELWGMDTEEYKKNKEEKIKLYEQEDLQLIQIYRKDVISDKALLKDNLESLINQKEKELKRKR